MTLRDASVDLDGNVLGVGRIIYPADEHGHFPEVAFERIRLSRRGNFGIAACRATRDEKTGFMNCESFGPELYAPKVVTAAIMDALHRGAKEPIVLSLQNQDGFFASSVDLEAAWEQPLSDWRLKLQEEQGSIRVELSAALHATQPIETWKKKSGNYWPPQENPARVLLEFIVDPMTRIACFGSFIKELSGDQTSEPANPIRTSLATLNIENAPVGSFVELGIGDSEDWVSFSSKSNSICITRINSQTRSSLGFMNLGSRIRWPRAFCDHDDAYPA